MVQYTLAQKPDLILTVPGKDSTKNREKAMSQLVEMMDEGTLDTELADGLSPDQLISVKDLQITTPDPDFAPDKPEDRLGSDSVLQAIQILSNLAVLKGKVQEIRQEALKIKEKIGVLFSDAPVSPEDLTELQDGFKVLKNFAQLNSRYQEAKSQAVNARQTLDRALAGD